MDVEVKVKVVLSSELAMYAAARAKRRAPSIPAIEMRRVISDILMLERGDWSKAVGQSKRKRKGKEKKDLGLMTLGGVVD